MAVILWGKPTITITGVSGGSDISSNLTVPTPAAGTTQLTTETGAEHTADLEGGGYEARRYDKNSFTFEFAVRFAQGRTMPFSDKSLDGNISGTYKIVLTSEESGAPSMTIHECNARYEDEYSAEDGARRHYFFEVIVPTGGGEQITWSTAAGSSS
jgi:hypothetical protein